MFTNILYEKSDGVAKITLNRPQVLNALNIEARKELIAALSDAESDSEVKVVILTGAGEKAFCAGADLSMFEDMTSIEAASYVEVAKAAVDSLEKLSKPVIAVVKGYAIGGGCELAMACDMIVASEDARFGQGEINVGLIPGVGATQRLPRHVGLKKAKELIFTGDLIGAQAAKDLGLVNMVVPPSELDATMDGIVKKLMEKSPLILKLAKQAINASMHTNLHEGLSLESKLFALCFTTGDQKEGVKAFFEKRRPVFKGR